jgi:signal transduction histidine kinase
MDLTQNAVEAGSSAVIVDLIEEADGRVKVYIADDGSGMDEETLKRARDPFFTGGGKHEKRSVGLGISFLAQFMAQCGGVWDIASEKGVGTSLCFEYDGKHLDAPPLGNIASAIVCCLGLPGGFELKFTRTLRGESYTVTRSEAAELFGDVSCAEALLTLRDYIRASEEELKELIAKGN